MDVSINWSKFIAELIHSHVAKCYIEHKIRVSVEVNFFEACGDWRQKGLHNANLNHGLKDRE